MFAEAIESILMHHCTPAAVRAIESGASAQTLANAISEAGFHDLLTPEDRGGGGAGWREFFDVVILCGAYAVPLPLAQTLAARAVAADSRELPPGLIAFAPILTRDHGGTLLAPHVPAALTASHVIAAQGEGLTLLHVADAEQLPSGVHGSLACSLRWQPDAGKPLRSALDAQAFQGIGALLQAGLLAGSMKRVFGLTMSYANDRVQFGKPIGKFQAIQHQLSVMAQHVAAAQIAAEAAFACDGPYPALAACAVAKSRTSEAAQLVASIGHAVHGAIGITEEYDLQLHTRRLHESRMAHGSEVYWNRVLGRLLIDSEEGLAADFARLVWTRDGAT